ncbi:MAG: hypothetical protein KDF58_07860 [Alphaproteobacteria bacterium]|mgnify:CR=1 FL=1|nr:hypothetical protein [Alphaproteobacteria bacterium]HPF46000.1 hypothetical protein [Emcibacteraceae bacterium]HRW30415.1 hypothetical protein [Emcibacteraceae bacterium]
MFIILIAIFITLVVIINSYKKIDTTVIKTEDIFKTAVPAIIAIACIMLRAGYFALPDEGMVSLEYLNYRKMLLWAFILLMGYIVRLGIFGVVYIFRDRP